MSLLRLPTAALAVALAVAAPAATPPPGTTWVLDSLTAIGGHPATLLGSPRLVDTPVGRAIEFDGVDDAIVLDGNPLTGLARFTVGPRCRRAAQGGPGHGTGEVRFRHFPYRALD